MARSVGSYGLNALLFAASPFLVWQLFVWIAQPNPRVFASPLQALDGIQRYGSSLIFPAMGQSLMVLAFAIPIAILLGLALAMLLSLVSSTRLILLPMLIGLFTMPVYALNRALFSIIQLGFGSKVIIACLILYFPILIAGLVGLRTIDPAVLEAGKLDGAGRFRILTAIMLPLAGPALAGGLMAAGAVAPLALFAAEFSGSRGGLGQLVISELARGRVEVAFAAVAMLILIGLALFALADGARRVLSRNQTDSFQLLS